MSGKTDKKVRKAVRKGVKSGEIPLPTMNPRPANQDDDNAAIIVPIGDMSRTTTDGVQFDKNYESMTEDFIGTFNHGVTQGMPPINALYAMGSAFAVVLGCAIRAGLPQKEVGKFLYMVGKNSAASSAMVQVLQGQTVTQAVANAVRGPKKVQ